MIWHQIQENGLQSIVLTLIAVMLTLVFIEGEITTTVAVIRMAGTTTMLRTAAVLFLSGVHFICKLESEVRNRKSEVRCPKVKNNNIQ